MIAHRCAPLSAEWFRLRLGRPTASEFHRILTPGGKLSKQSEGYMNRLLAEAMLGRQLDEVDIQTKWMQRGQELESSGISAYEFQNDVETEPGGFFTNDTGTIGASPDRLVESRGLLELKCPAPPTHIQYLLTGSVEEDYLPQLQGQLYITERDWVDICSFHPELPPVVIRVLRDEAYIVRLSAALESFGAVLTQKRMILEAKFGPFPSLEPVKEDGIDSLGITNADLEEILADIAKRQ